MVWQRVRTGAAAVLVLPVALGACTPAESERRVPSARDRTAGTPTAGGAAATDEVAEYVEAKRAWVRCLRGRGIDVGDPDPLGQVAFADPRAKAEPHFVAAQQQCQRLLPPVPERVHELLRPKHTASQIAQRQRYARCMQDNGAPDFPDPDADGHYDRHDSGEQQWDPTTPGARQAARVCGPIIGDPATPGPGRG